MKKDTLELAVTKQINSTSQIDQLYSKISNYIDTARQNVQRSIDTEMVKAHWLTGHDIVEEEQHGQSSAQYGAHIIKELASRLNNKYGKGFSVTILKNARYFYLTYPERDQIGQTASAQFNQNLGWSHYERLMKITRPEVRNFYEIEAIKNNWKVSELKRQIGSLLFDRLAKSKDKAGLEAELKKEIALLNQNTSDDSEV